MHPSTLVFFPPVFTLGFLGLSLRPVEIAPSQLLLWTGSMESCHVQGMTAMGVSLPRHFFKVKYFWKAVGLLVNMYSCIHCSWSTVISKIFCAWTVKRGILWECRMWRRVFQSFLGAFWCRSCAAWYKTGHVRCPWVWGTAYSRAVVELVPYLALLQVEEANLKIGSNKLLVCSKPGGPITGFCSQTERQSPVTLVFVLTVSQSPSNY